MADQNMQVQCHMCCGVGRSSLVRSFLTRLLARDEKEPKETKRDKDEIPLTI